ncbi:TPA: hypothetical protein ACH3X1_012295 [Trebouxia sp. C0004]
MNLARRIQASKLCSLVEFAITNNNRREIHIVTPGNIPCRQTSVILPSAAPSSSSYKFLCRSIVTLEQAQGQIDELNDKFVEARDEIEYAQEDAETTYFNESHKLARESVGVVTTMYKEILADLSEAEKGKLQRSMGMKMEQLKVHICAACLVSFCLVCLMCNTGKWQKQYYDFPQAELGQLDTLHT